MRTGTLFRALHRLEWRRVLRTPAWLFNGLAGVVMYPLMLGIGVISGFSSAPEGSQLPDLMKIIPSPCYIICFGGLLMAMGSMVNPVVSTAVSREGGCWPFALALPVRQQDRFTAKLIVGIEISTLCSTLIAIVAWVLTRVNPLILLCALVFTLMINIAVSAVSLWHDATHPHFRWANETEAIKKNFNQVFGMLYWLAAIALCCIPLFFWLDKPVLLMAAMIAIAAAEMALGLWLLYRTANRMNMMEE